MLILTPEDVKFCFVKQSPSNALMGIKYGNWCFYFEKFLNLDLNTVKIKYQDWSEEAEKKGELRAILEKDGGVYLCVDSGKLEPLTLSEAIVKIAENMKSSQELEKTFHHRSWRRSRKCFQGKKAVNWMIKKLNISRLEAIKLGQKCLEQDLFAHVLDCNIFEDDEKQFYFFREQ